jgi:hypothetical protein
MPDDPPSARARDPSQNVERLANAPEAERWAYDCGWLPGTGHCDYPGCSERCVFYEGREAEIRQIQIARRRRRAGRQPFASRCPRRR